MAKVIKAPKITSFGGINMPASSSVYFYLITSLSVDYETLWTPVYCRMYCSYAALRPELRQDVSSVYKT